MSDPSRNAGATAGSDENPEGRDRLLSPAARRALAEAAARRAEIKVKARLKEHAGRKGPDPARYGDWEVKGIAVDF